MFVFYSVSLLFIIFHILLYSYSNMTSYRNSVYIKAFAFRVVWFIVDWKTWQFTESFRSRIQNFIWCVCFSFLFHFESSKFDKSENHFCVLSDFTILFLFFFWCLPQTRECLYIFCLFDRPFFLLFFRFDCLFLRPPYSLAWKRMWWVHAKCDQFISKQI